MSGPKRRPGGARAPDAAVRRASAAKVAKTRKAGAAQEVAADGPAIHATKQRLLEAGLRMLLEQGYNDLGIQELLAATGIPKGSFYHHFEDKEDFALQVIDAYMTEVHAGLDACLRDPQLPPLARVRRFFELTQEKYRSEGYMGCLLGGVGQELSGVSEVFRRKIETCFSFIAGRLAVCLEEARARGDVPPHCDVRKMADILVDCWEGAALRCRLRRDPGSLAAMLDFYIASVCGGTQPAKAGAGSKRRARTPSPKKPETAGRGGP